MKALEKDRGRRFATVNALARDIERHLSDLPVEEFTQALGQAIERAADLVAGGRPAGPIEYAVRDPWLGLWRRQRP